MPIDQSGRPAPESFLPAAPAESLPLKQAARAAERRSMGFRSAPATYLLLGVNILVFLLMTPFGPLPALFQTRLFGSMLTEPFSFAVLANFGGSLASAVLNDGQWWRLLTAAFVHANTLHLLVNMWCLWNLGLLGEPLLGRNGLIATYLLTGVAGNMLSLVFAVAKRQDELVVGASGAIFGIAGILIVLLSNKRLAVPWEELKGLRRSVIQFAVLNLVIGLAPQFLLPMSALQGMPALAELTHIDNSAHLGGFVAGILLGLPLLSRMTAGRPAYRARQKLVFVAAAFALVLLGYGLSVAGKA